MANFISPALGKHQRNRLKDHSKMSDEDAFEKILGGAFQQDPGKTVTDELRRVFSAIMTLAQAISDGVEMTDERYRLLKVDIEGLSTKLDGKASQASIDTLKTDSETIKRKLDILINNKRHVGPK